MDILSLTPGHAGFKGRIIDAIKYLHPQGDEMGFRFGCKTTGINQFNFPSHYRMMHDCTVWAMIGLKKEVLTSDPNAVEHCI
jgi:hypothetical protein